LRTKASIIRALFAGQITTSTKALPGGLDPGVVDKSPHFSLSPTTGGSVEAWKITLSPGDAIHWVLVFYRRSGAPTERLYAALIGFNANFPRQGFFGSRFRRGRANFRDDPVNCICVTYFPLMLLVTEPRAFVLVDQDGKVPDKSVLQSRLTMAQGTLARSLSRNASVEE